MTAKDYLSELHTMEKSVNILTEKVQELEHRISGLKGITYDGDKVQTSPEDRLSDLVPKLVQLKKRLTKEYTKLVSETIKRERMIRSIGNATYSEVLILRYVAGQKWEQVSETMGYSYRQTTRLHGNALAAFERKYRATLERCP